MEIARSITIDAPSDRVWEVLAGRFHDVGDWASMIETSKAVGSAPEGGVADRMCHTPQGIFKEKVTRLDHDKRELAYLVYEGLPGFVREGGNTWWVKDLGASKTEVSFRMKFDLNPFADLLMGWMMKRQMGRMADDVAQDLKTYLETGRVSEAKRAAKARAA